jgi:hypothetical protein
MTSCGIVFIAFSNLEERRNARHYILFPANSHRTAPDIFLPLGNSRVGSVLLTCLINSAL